MSHNAVTTAYPTPFRFAGLIAHLSFFWKLWVHCVLVRFLQKSVVLQRKCNWEVCVDVRYRGYGALAPHLHHLPHCMSEELCALVQEVVTLLANSIALRRLLHYKDSGLETNVYCGCPPHTALHGLLI